ncbi:MAG: class I SAM-dependent methyltransferase [Candidatus Edwardsbacteria bacterium]|nr:class I SAM-dependent methyltransferase [Candidatus Edwardsbacteria bacterium]
MSSYLGRHAVLYDVFYRDKPYEREAAFVHRCLRRHGGGRIVRLLEIACGTGRHALQFARKGYEVTAVDHSRSMLAVAKSRMEKAGHRDARLLLQDMRQLNVSGPPFDAAVCLFDSIGYVRTDDAIRRTLNGVRRHLRPGGLFIFEFWHGPAMLKHYDPLRVRRWCTGGKGIWRISETKLDRQRHLGIVKYNIFEQRGDGAYDRIAETQTNRFFTIREMRGFLNGSGFNPLKWFAGFSSNERITDQTWHVVAVAKKI